MKKQPNVKSTPAKSRTRSTNTNGATLKKTGTTQKKRSTTATAATTERQNAATTNDGNTAYGSLLEKLFATFLKEMYWAENQQVEFLSEMQFQATTDELQDALEDHVFASQKHVSRLEKVFFLLGLEAEEKTCIAVEGLINEARQIIAETKDDSMTRDAALIIAAQRIEHYEIASYGSMVQLALTLGYGQAASLLEKTLWEEENTDKYLTEIAECEVNPLADEEPVMEGYDYETA
jgi:ferritin-like metal-binding protein YciE